MHVSRKEVLRYLGYHGKSADKKVLCEIGRCERLLNGCISPRSVSRHFRLSPGDGCVSIGNETVNSLKLRIHLDGCCEAILFAATLGPGPDMLIERYSKTAISTAVILEACAACMIESYCDEYEKSFALEESKRGFYLKPRFSPGYGDFDISYQQFFMNVLDCPKRIGLSLTDGFMLSPTKSVTAVIGLTGKSYGSNTGKCADCSMKNCPYREDGR